jgi:hypothetical protein
MPDGLDVKTLKDKGIIASDVLEELIQDAIVFGILSGIDSNMDFVNIKAEISVGTAVSPPSLSSYSFQPAAPSQGGKA